MICPSDFSVPTLSMIFSRRSLRKALKNGNHDHNRISRIIHVFYKKLGSGHSAKKVFKFNMTFCPFWYKKFRNWLLIFEGRIVNVTANAAADMFLDIQHFIYE